MIHLCIACSDLPMQLCSPVVAAPVYPNPAFEIANPPIAKNADRMDAKSNPTLEGQNSECLGQMLLGRVTSTGARPCEHACVKRLHNRKFQRAGMAGNWVS